MVPDFDNKKVLGTNFRNQKPRSINVYIMCQRESKTKTNYYRRENRLINRYIINSASHDKQRDPCEM